MTACDDGNMPVQLSRFLVDRGRKPAAGPRRLRAGAGAVLMVLLIAAAPAAFAAEPGPRQQVVHILNRLAFGPTAADAAHVEQIGIDAYIAEQLDPQAIPEPAALTRRLAELDMLHAGPIDLANRYGPPRPRDPKPTPEELKKRRHDSAVVLQQAGEARVWRALYSPRQLEEVMVNFWFNHFNIDGRKGLDRVWTGAFEEQAIRPHALGKFRDLLVATARHPAMLFYLDNYQNSAPGTKAPNGKEIGLNENYARELMELHTLGVDGGYTQQDVIALARILTGWSFIRIPESSPDGTGFYFRKPRHDFGPKHFLGRDIAPSGEAEGMEALDMLARSPATAHHIAFQLAQYFVADEPPPALVDRLAARFRDTDGDIRAILQTLFASPEFRDSIGKKYKTPYQYVLSATRAAGLAVDNPRPLMREMARLGMPLYGCQTPDGYQDTADKWLSPDAGPLRVSFATELASGRLPLQGPPRPAVQNASAGPSATTGERIDAAALQALLDPVLSPRSRTAIGAAAPAERAALLLGGPDFMRR